MPHRDIVTIGASAGGVEALRFLVGKLPAKFDASVLITMHLAEDFPSTLDHILTRAGSLPAQFARENEKIERGRIYLAPPKRHLLLSGDRLELGHGPRENNARPAIDPMFRSVALCCGGRSVGVVLSGMLGDGAAGLRALKQCGGLSVAQKPSDAAFPEMPATAVRRALPDHVVGLAELPALLKKLVQQPVGEALPIPHGLSFEVEIARSGGLTMKEMDRIGRRSVLACPDCHGVMWEIDEGDLVRYRCHVGHAYTAELMKYAIDENLARALGSALRALDERIAITEKLHAKAADLRHNNSAEWWQRRLDDTRREAEVIREAIMRMERIGTEKVES
ncbi:MAG TPA: chemotaxis protein CheB [Stellaceae bacterium]|jgi:two-component system chemotaxis response regulator CheB